MQADRQKHKYLINIKGLENLDDFFYVFKESLYLRWKHFDDNL